MDISVKHRIISEIINSNDEQILNAVKSLLKIEDEVDFWEGLTTEYQAAIDEGLEQLDKGKYEEKFNIKLMNDEILDFLAKKRTRRMIF